ncbi:hypothetical protein D3C72_2154560 [compost metagenome]
MRPHRMDHRVFDVFLHPLAPTPIAFTCEGLAEAAGPPEVGLHHPPTLGRHHLGLTVPVIDVAHLGAAMHQGD